MEQIVRKLASLVTVLGLGLVPASLAGAADGQRTAKAGQASGTIAPAIPADVDLRKWDPDSLASGWLASRLLDAKVYAKDPKPIGDVKNLILDMYGTIKSLVVGRRSPLDLRDNLFYVPWNEVRVGKNLDRITVAIESGSAKARTDFEDEPLGGGEIRLTEVMVTIVVLEDGSRYGFVDDLVFSRQGRLLAVVAQPGPGTRSYAIPSSEATYDRHARAWRFPFSQEEVVVLQPYAGDS